MRTLEHLCSSIRNDERLEGVVTTIVEHRSSNEVTTPEVEVDAFVARHGYSAIGEGWTELTRDAAIVHLQGILSRSLAYNTETMDQAEALSIAQEIADFFATAPSHWFTNGDHGSWRSISSSTCDNATVAIDGSKSLLILFEDED